MDKSCELCRTEFSAFIDGQLNHNLQAEIQSHLNDCQHCNEELASLKSLTKMVADGLSGGEFAIPDLWAGIAESMPPLCELVREDFSAYIDGELPAAAQEGVTVHLKQCQVCLDEFNLLNETNRLLAKGLELPDGIEVDLWPSVKARLNEDCALIASELSAYLDQEVVTLRHRSITSHLIECGDCRYQFTQLANVGDIIRDSYKPRMEENFDLWPKIRSELAVVPITSAKSKTTQINTKQKTKNRRFYVAAAAAAVIGVSGSLALLTNVPKLAHAENISSETYLIESALMEPADVAEAVVYEQN